MESKEQETLEITFSTGNFNREEIKEISEAFSEIVPISVRYYARETIEILPAILIFSLGFVFGSIAEGFFREIGSDLYKKAKEKVAKSLKDKHKASLIFEMTYKNTVVKISNKTNDEQELSKMFDTIDKARDLLIAELDKNEIPEMTEIGIRYDNGWVFVSGVNWKPLNKPYLVKFYEYDKKTQKWKLTEDWSNK